MEHDYHQFRSRLRENKIKWDEEAEAELARIKRILETLDETNEDGRLTAAANQSRQARNNPFLQTTARPQARRRCEQQLKKAEHEATLACQHLYICLEKVRFQKELLSAFSEEPIEAEVETNKPDRENLGVPFTQEEVCPQKNIEFESKYLQLFGKQKFEPYIATIVNTPSPILGPTHAYMDMFPSTRGPTICGEQAGFSSSELQELAKFEDKLEAGSPLLGCDLGLVMRALTHRSKREVKYIDNLRDRPLLTCAKSHEKAARTLARWWALLFLYAQDRNKSDFWPVGFFHGVEGPDFDAWDDKRCDGSHVRIVDPRIF